MEEYDLVDEQDNVIGVTNKELAHKKGHIHRIAAVYVFRYDGKLLVQEHIKSGGKLDNSIGGHVTKGETYDAAAKREAAEELGITDPLKKLSVFYSDETFRGGTRKHMFALYECSPSESWKFIPNDEVQRLIPMNIKEIVEAMNTEPLKFTPGFINTMKEYLQNKKAPYTVNG